MKADFSPRCPPTPATCLPRDPETPACCTSRGDCGYDLATYVTGWHVASGCQRIGQPGVNSQDCPALELAGTVFRCCRFDGTCGIDMSQSGLGCVKAASADATPCNVGGSCRFDLQVTTVTANGTFAPHNVGAVWIEDGSGAFVKTLSDWGRTLLSEAVAWYSSSNGNGVDAISGATRIAQGPLQAGWNCTDASGAAVPPGRYRVCMTYAEDNSAAPIRTNPSPPIMLCVPFDLGSAPFVLTPAGDEHFSDIHIVLTF